MKLFVGASLLFFCVSCTQEQQPPVDPKAPKVWKAELRIDGGSALGSYAAAQNLQDDDNCIQTFTQGTTEYLLLSNRPCPPQGTLASSWVGTPHPLNASGIILSLKSSGPSLGFIDRAAGHLEDLCTGSYKDRCTLLIYSGQFSYWYE